MKFEILKKCDYSAIAIKKDLYTIRLIKPCVIIVCLIMPAIATCRYEAMRLRGFQSLQ